MELTLNNITDIAEDLGWAVSIFKDDICFQIYGKYGKDFNLEFPYKDGEQLLHDLYDYVDNYDVSYETYIWLDDFGHGKNSAPYEMENVLEEEKWLSLIHI